jgi:glycosyltransferase involved in cell wall biosynthesis
MTASIEAHQTPATSDSPFGARWREAQARVQEDALPEGRVAVSCSAPRGTGGLGRHLDEIFDALQRGAREPVGIGDDPTHWRASGRSVLGMGVAGLAGRLAGSRLPVSPAVRTWASMTDFDAHAAQHLPAAEHLIAFNGQALRQFGAARRGGYRSVSLVAANSHLRQVARQHARAHEQYPLEGSWTTHLIKRNLAEYARADRIYIASPYIRESFLREGCREETLADFPLMPDPRYERGRATESAGSFDVVYVGSLAVHKGVPLLIDAVRRLAHADLRLVLVGGWGTRGMRRFVQRACAADRRISVCPGDPLPHLRRAGVCVHPAYEDGFAYAPAEAVACGVPVIVSEDTGMKHLIDPPRTGAILPTGDLGALTEAIDAAYRAELFVG